MPLRRPLLVAALVLPLVLAGCKIDTINYFPPKAAQVRFANFVPDAAALDVVSNGEVVWAAVKPEAVTAYRDFDSEQHPFAFRIAGSTAEVAGNKYSLNGEQRYTLLSLGTAAAPAMVMVPDTTSEPGGDNFRARVLQLAPTVNAIDMYVTAPTADIADRSPDVNTLSYGGTGVYRNYAPGTYRIRVTPFGTKTVIYDSGTVTFSGSRVANLVVYSRGSGTLVNVAMLETTGTASITVLDTDVARVRAVHLANATGAVDVLADRVPLFAGLAPATPAAYASLPRGAHDFTVEAAATPGAVLAQLGRTLVPATDTTLYVKGSAGSQSIIALDDDNIPALSGGSRLRIVNVTEDGATIDVLAGTTVIASAVSATAAPAYVELASSTYTLTVRNTATGATLPAQTNFAPAVATVYTLYVAGTASQPALVLAQDK